METEDIVAQGSMEGSLISSSNLTRGVADFFETSEQEESYASLRLLPCQLQDDLLRFCSDPVSAQMGNDRFEAMAEVKLLSYNIDKCKVLILGEKKAKKKLEESFKANPPTL